jgi:hypothetical protein
MSPTVADISNLFRMLAQEHKQINHNVGGKLAFLGFDELEISANELNPAISFPAISMSLPQRTGMQNRYEISNVGEMRKTNTFTFSVLAPVDQFDKDYEAVMSQTTSIVDDFIIRLQQLAIEGKATCEWYSDVIFNVVDSFKVGPIGASKLYGFAATISITHTDIITKNKNTLVWQ